jgi:hypothetical protein
MGPENMQPIGLRSLADFLDECKNLMMERQMLRRLVEVRQQFWVRDLPGLWQIVDLNDDIKNEAQKKIRGVGSKLLVRNELVDAFHRQTNEFVSKGRRVGGNWAVTRQNGIHNRHSILKTVGN